MAFDVYSYFNQLHPSLLGGLPPDQAASAAQSLINKIQGGNSSAYDQLNEMFGPQVSQELINGYRSDQTTAPTQNLDWQPPAPPPTPAQNPAQSPIQNAIDPSQVTQLPGTDQATTPNPYAANGYGFTLPHDQGAIHFGNPTFDIQAIMDLARQEQTSSLGLLNTQDTRNKQYLTDLGKILEEQQARQMNSELPGVYEDLNTRGLLRSSDLGNRLALRAKELTADTSTALAKQGLAYNDQYTQGLRGVLDQYQNNQNKALSRGFSIEDFNNQVGASQLLGYALQPKPADTGKSAGQGAVDSSIITTGAKLAAK